MSVLIKGMEMPKTCKECIFSRYILGEWFCRTTTTPDYDGTELWESVGKDGHLHRADFCPLVPVPPHGRLIDADALMELIKAHDYPLRAHFNSTDNGMFTIGIQQAVDELPTIIPAEEGE